jgi:biotin synthase-related radical SAM superfamily protein
LIDSDLNGAETPLRESPDHVRLSLAAAMTLGYKEGLFYRNARMHCINLLLTYRQGCLANCAYCGLARERTGAYEEKSFIHVEWPVEPLFDVIERAEKTREIVRRICISMITNKRAVEDTLEVTRRIRSLSDIPISLLISPTILAQDHLVAFREAGADKIGIAVDAATESLFEKYRGKAAGGPHRWSRYWELFGEAVRIFGERNVGAHFIVGLDEAEEEMMQSIGRVNRLGGVSHLFAFFPEKNSALAERPMAPVGQYRRIQLARYLVDEEGVDFGKLQFDARGRITGFGVTQERLDAVIRTGEPFRTSGCKDASGRTACNRPFGNSYPGPDLKNYPFPLNEEDVERVRRQLTDD